MRTGPALATTLLLFVRVARAAAPIPWVDATGHVGENVTVEGDVAAASSTPDQVVLEFAPADPLAFRVVLIVPLMTDLPRFPERLYQGKRVRASGVVQRFHGRAEMVLRAPGQIEVVDVAGPTSAPVAAALAAPAPPPVATPRAAAVAPVVAPPTPTPVVPPAPAPVVPAPPAPPPAARVEAPVAAAPTTTSTSTPSLSPIEALAELRCTHARDRWQEAARHSGELADQLRRCLAAKDYHCRTDAAALAPALSELEWAEQQVADACP